MSEHDEPDLDKIEAEADRQLEDIRSGRRSQVSRPAQDRLDLDDTVVDKDHRLDWRGFMRRQLPTDNWYRMCQSLQRQAHGFYAVYPSAYAAMVATKDEDRYTDYKGLPNTAFIYHDDSSDSNPYGHVTGKWGESSKGTVMVVTNDADGPGQVSIKPIHWFRQFWGDPTRFGALRQGVQQIPTHDRKPSQPKQTGAEDTAEKVRAALDAMDEGIEAMKRAIKDNSGKQHPAHEKALKRDLEAMRTRRADLRKRLPDGEGSK